MSTSTMPSTTPSTFPSNTSTDTVAIETSLAPDPRMAGQHQAPTLLQGTCAEGLGRIREVFEEYLANGTDIGASVAAFIDGEPVLDLWGGYFDDSYTRPWSEHTITNTYSSTKTMTALCALLLADRGELDLDAPIAEYWPEFAASGKSEVKVKYLLGHSSGVAGWDRPMTLAGICDMETSTALLAQQEPWWEPGTAAGYHGFTQGHLVGEVIHRLTGKRLGQFLAEEVMKPLGVDLDYYIGTPEERDPWVSRLVPCFPTEPRGNAMFDRAMLNPPAMPRDTWSITWRRAGMGALNGHGNARGLATAQSILASGRVRGVQLMSDNARTRVLEQQADGPDLVLDIPLRWGLGYCLNTEILPAAPGHRVAWWAGNGGSMSFVDLDQRLSFAYVPNKWITGAHEMDRHLRLLNELYVALATQ